jgi:hypothetical protein
MSELKIKGLVDRSIDIPNICANCKHNHWREDGCHCSNKLNWQQTEEEETENEWWMEDDDGEIEWSFCCNHHERGNPWS